MGIATVGSWWMWGGFVALVVVLVAVDLLALRSGGAQRLSMRAAAGWTLFWVALALLFNAALWWYLDGSVGRAQANQKALEFLTGYLIEKALAVDNIFVFLLIFGYLRVPLELQRLVLVYGVLGAIVLRAAMILAGAWLISEFHFVLYLFGAFLLFTGVRMFFSADHAPDLEDNRLLRWLRRRFNVTDRLHGERFFVRENGLRHATPLFLAVVMIELSDVVFAVDSIPAIFAITTDPFIVFTSNIFAILGLRALYFLLAGAADRFHLLKYGLALVLAFVGAKMLLAPWFEIPILAALAAVGLIIGGAVAGSLLNPPKQGAERS